MFKKALIYLGLGPDEEYDQFAQSGDAVEAVRPVRDAAASRPSGTVHPIAATRPAGRPTVRPVAAAPDQGVGANPGASRTASSAVKIVEPLAAKPHAVSPMSFNEAQEIGDRFKMGQPVIVNLQGADRDLRRRLIDFASGLCYALGGKMDKVATHVYMLTPTDVEVTAAEARQALD